MFQGSGSTQAVHLLSLRLDSLLCIHVSVHSVAPIPGSLCPQYHATLHKC